MYLLIVFWFCPMSFVMGQPWKAMPPVAGYIRHWTATSCARYTLLQFLCRCSLIFQGYGVQKSVLTRILEKTIFIKTWKKIIFFYCTLKKINVALYLSYLYHWYTLRPKELISHFIVWPMILRLGFPFEKRHGCKSVQRRLDGEQFCSLYDTCSFGRPFEFWSRKAESTN